MISTAIQAGSKNEKTNMPMSVTQVKTPGMISMILCASREPGSVVFGSGKVNDIFLLIIDDNDADRGDDQTELQHQGRHQQQMAGDPFFLSIKMSG